MVVVVVGRWMELAQGIAHDQPFGNKSELVIVYSKLETQCVFPSSSRVGGCSLPRFTVNNATADTLWTYGGTQGVAGRRVGELCDVHACRDEGRRRGIGETSRTTHKQNLREAEAKPLL